MNHQADLTPAPNTVIGQSSLATCMALSADGNTCAIGGPYDNSGMGAVWIFTRSKDHVWTQQAKLTPFSSIGNSSFGSSLAISWDGDMLLVGGPADNNYAGAFWVCFRNEGVWQVGLKLAHGDTKSFGSSVALSVDKKTVLVGASGGTGSAWVYNLKTILSIGNTLPVALSIGDPGAARIGASVALSADGTVAAVGAPGRGSVVGETWIFHYTDTGWNPVGSKLPDRPDAGSNIGFGTSVALSARGDVVLVGSFGNATDPTQAGAWVFVDEGNGWTQQGGKLLNDSPYMFGQEVSLSADGETAIVADWNLATGPTGTLFTLQGGSWLQTGPIIQGGGPPSSGYSIGGSVAISADADTFLIGGYDQDRDYPVGVFVQNDDLEQITHVFVLMLENHSFDNILGLSGIANIISSASSGSNSYNGTDYPVSNKAPPSMPTDPAHEFADIMEQLCGSTLQKSWVNGQPYPQPITNSGFVSNYATSKTEIHSGNPRIPTEAEYTDIMQCFDTPNQLPVIYQLATEFAVCDQWFASLPGPTFPNRAFLHGGSSSGLADSQEWWQTPTWLLDGFTYANGSIFDSLRNRGVVYKIFVDPPTSAEHFVPPPVCLLKGIHYVDTYSYNDFDTAVKDPFYAEGYTFIEPNYGEVLTQSFKNGSSQHPMDGVYGGENLIKKTYETIRNSPHWDNSLLVIVYDEHGGFYDSFAPGPAPAPNDKPNYVGNTKFNFELYGVRVPAVVVSPRIKKGTVDHTVYDHTSVLATLAELFGLKSLTDRSAKAKPLQSLLTVPPRTDCPAVLNNPVPPPPSSMGIDLVALSPEAENQELPTSGNVPSFLATLLKTDLQLSSGDEAERARKMAAFEGIKTVGEARAYAKQVAAKVEQAKLVDANTISPGGTIGY